MTKDSGFRDLSPISNYNKITTGSSNVNTFPPNTQDGIFNNLVVGIDNYVFKVTEKGMWLGAENFDDAPFKVSMGGEVTIGGYLSDAYLLEGEAASDINTHTTTISGGKITTGSVTANQIAAGTITSEKIGAYEIKAINIAAGVIAANHIATGAITGIKLANGSVSEVKIAGAAVTGSKIANSTITDSKIVNGTITGTKIAGGTISGTNIAGGTITGVNIQDSSINHTKLSVTSLSAITATLGSVTSGTITGSIIVIPNESGGSVGYLRWSGGSRIWNDGSNNMGYRALGGYHYFYSGYTEKLVLTPNGYQDVFRQGIVCQGSLNVQGNGAITGYWNVSGTSTIQGRLTLNTFAYFNAGMILTGTSQVNAHINAWTNGNYNLGGSDAYWRYVNCYRVSEHSMTSFDSPVEMRDGRKLDDIEALKAIKTDKIIDKTTGRPFLDKRTFPKDVMIPAYDQETGKPYKRDKNDRPLVPNEKGKLEPRPDTDGIATGQMLSLLFGGFKQLVARVEELEEQSKKNVKI